MSIPIVILYEISSTHCFDSMLGVFFFFFFFFFGVFFFFFSFHLADI